MLPFILIFIIAAIFLGLSLWFGAPFVATVPWVTKRMIAVADIQKDEKVVDLGSGDGRLVIAMAKAGALSHGYEINPLLVWYSRYKIRKAGLSGRAFVHRKNYWNEDLSSYTLVAVFGITYIMEKLEKKLRKELRPKARVICLSYPFPNWKPVKKEESVYVYRQE